MPIGLGFYYTIFLEDLNFNIYRHGLEHMWPGTIPFILHLALCDMVYCLFVFPGKLFTYLSMLIGYEAVIPPAICKMSWIPSTFSLITGWLAQAIVAMTRAILLINRKWLRQLFGKTKNLPLFFMAAWVYTILVMTPYLLEVGINAISIL